MVPYPAVRRPGFVMSTKRLSDWGQRGLLLLLVASLAGCGHLGRRYMSERECMARAMYFESIRSSDEGMLAVGTVVMNRVESGQYPQTVCGVVGQANQFAPGVLTREMPQGTSRDRAMRVAGSVLSGQRHRQVGGAEFFHTAGRTYSYSNMHYVLVAGGNAFYERQPTRGRSYIPRNLIAQAGPTSRIYPGRYALALVEPEEAAVNSPAQLSIEDLIQITAIPEKDRPLCPPGQAAHATVECASRARADTVGGTRGV